MTHKQNQAPTAEATAELQSLAQMAGNVAITEPVEPDTDMPGVFIRGEADGWGDAN